LKQRIDRTQALKMPVLARASIPPLNDLTLLQLRMPRETPLRPAYSKNARTSVLFMRRMKTFLIRQGKLCRAKNPAMMGGFDRLA
jgi:hypothetical protein